MKIIWILIPFAIIVSALLFLSQNSKRISQNSPLPAISFTPDLTPISVNFTASFEIYTLGTKRIFTDKKYHNLTEDVYITSEEPSIIYVKKSGIKWSEFFATLPMKLEKDCLTTGTGQVFCTSEKNKLKFYVNDMEDPDALDKEIDEDGKLKVIYE